MCLNDIVLELKKYFLFRKSRAKWFNTRSDLFALLPTNITHHNSIMSAMMLPKELLAHVVEYLYGDSRSMFGFALSCKVYFNWMINDKLFDDFWKLVAKHIRRGMNK